MDVVLLLSQTRQALVETWHLVIHFLIWQIKVVYTILGHIYPIPLQPWQAHGNKSDTVLSQAVQQNVRVTLKGNHLCWAWLVILLDTTAQCDLERGRHCVFKVLCVSLCGWSCSCARGPGRGNEEVSARQRQVTGVHPHSLPPLNLQRDPEWIKPMRVNKTHPFLGRRKLASTGSEWGFPKLIQSVGTKSSIGHFKQTGDFQT